jgi:NAD(P)-dependent dehydrogenase (short-subunit alcohol dehydrogenase family)
MFKSINDIFRLQGKAVLITGAGGGLGREFARVLSGNGADVICWDIDVKGLDETRKLIQEDGAVAAVDTVDVGDEESVKAGILRAHRAVSRIDVLINNAGISTHPVRIHELSIADWDRLIRINLTGTFLCSKHVLPEMMKSKAGSIINISSILGLSGFYPEQSVVGAAYSASKAAIDGFTRQLAAEYACENIRCNSIAPGFFSGTDLGRERRTAASPGSNEAFISSVQSRTPFNRFGTSDDLLGLILYLTSDASKYTTGQTFAIDGGWTTT